MIFVGRLIRSKGILELLEALAVVSRRISCRLVVCGDGPELIRARQIVADAGLEARVIFLGWQSNDAVRQWLAKSDVFVLPTYQEGFPMAVMEAMAAGLPIITTRVGAMPDHLRDQVNALFVRPGDVGALATCLEQMLCDESLRRRMGNQNSDLVREFDPLAVTAGYLAFIKERLSKQREVAAVSRR